MSHEIEPRRSDAYSMTPFNFFEDFGRSFFDGFKANMIKTDIHENDSNISLKQSCLVFLKKIFKSLMRMVF